MFGSEEAWVRVCFAGVGLVAGLLIGRILWGKWGA